MNREEFERLYIGRFDPDWEAIEAANFIDRATREQICQARRGWLDIDLYNRAKKIREQSRKARS